MRVLGIDPGYAIVGWGVVEYAGNRFAPVDFGAVCTDAGVPFERRLDEVYTGIKEVIERTKPEVLAIEKLFYQHNQTTVIGVAEARGVILLAAAQAGLPIYEYTPMQVKQAVTGYGKAVKKQVQEMTRVLLHLPAGRYRRCAGYGHYLLSHQRQPAQPLYPPGGGTDLTDKKLPLRGKTSPAPGEDVAQRQKGESVNAIRH